MGPTASGKTGVAVELAQHLPVELISVDSALVFRDMDIGTAKPDAATLAKAPHHLIDIISPTEAYSAAAFRHDALRLMADITARGKVPLLVGGTMLYFKALREGLSPLPQADAEVRAGLDAIIAQHGIEHLHAELAKVDAETAARLHSTDTQRVQRAMEVYLVSGKPMSELIKKPSPLPQAGEGLGERVADDLQYRILPLALFPSDRAVLHQRIAMRFEQMLKDGLVDELRGLRQKYPLHLEMTSMRCVGYRQAWEYMEGEIDEVGLLEKGIAATRQLAKRQLTWLRSMEVVKIDCLAGDMQAQVSRMVAEAIGS
ncbi:MAG: tRNA (adenosine(37)-N6)-dimethylallyltransferase MiaA [Gammaproteobacteria bacterium]|nr:tRNA (adenosine(37)-N6)-dimethylallyltransferase MiaA [Gammaproteobacteria bacterium]MBU1776333.1 tRNA (adenosine(37)-N6)-dimethylallyltransferase MiaA [Gammaproteobacteria bacterium]MBU1967813.1 tRNA (adenosine(37)-N6)-dimethylallyltransferase MiaA [Gammaproteobacteria bacterium]